MMYRLSDDFVIRNILDECIVVPTKNMEDEGNGFLALNTTGKVIINCIKDGKSTDDIIAQICDEFEIDFDTASADIKVFIEEFKSKGIITEQ